MAKLTKKQADYYGRYIPEILDFLAGCVERGEPTAMGVLPIHEAISNVAEGLRSSAKKEA